MNIKLNWFIAFYTVVLFASAEEILFKEPRDAKIQINDSSLPWLVGVDFISVKCFDTGKNLEINRLKSENLLKAALLKKINATPDQVLQLSELRRISDVQVGDRFQAKFEISQRPTISQSQINVNKEEKYITNTENFSKNKIEQSSLIARKQDIFETIGGLNKILLMQIPIAPGNNVSDRQKDIFFTGIAEFEEKCVREFETLKKEIESDKLLLSNERKETLDRLNDAKAKLLQELTIHVQNFLN